MPAIAVIFVAAFVVFGYILNVTWLVLCGLALAIILLVTLATRQARFFRPYFRRWQTLSPVARERGSGDYKSVAVRRNGGVFLILVSVALILASGPLLLRTEAKRGADLNNPGIVFVVYNRLAAPELGELIDLFVIRELPLEQICENSLAV